MKTIPYQKCPVCDGRRTVPNGFYVNYSHPSAANFTGQEPCQTCNGAGVILQYVVEEKEILPSPYSFKKRRLNLNLSMQKVMDETGVSKATISRLENKKQVFYETVYKLHKFYEREENDN